MPKNPIVREYEIELDKVRHIRFDLAAMIRFQEMTDVNLLDGFDSSTLRNPKNLQALIYSCLVHEDPDLMPDTISPYVGFGNIPIIMKIVGAAVKNAYPDQEELEDSSEESTTEESPLESVVS
jgi:hypothetical protein